MDPTLAEAFATKLCVEMRHTQAWQDTASTQMHNAEFYHAIVEQVGALFGLVARLSDDNSVQQGTLALKVPMLVEDAIIRRLRMEQRANELRAIADYAITQTHFGATHGGLSEQELRKIHDHIVERLMKVELISTKSTSSDPLKFDTDKVELKRPS